MLNDFEVIVWMIWLKLIPFPKQEDKVLDFLQIIALFVKQSNNDPALYNVFEKFYSHNYPNFYARFKFSQKPDIHLTSADINRHYKTLTRNFNYKEEKGIKDFNYEVDALEAEHDKREVHTTTKFEEEKLKKMEEEAKLSNAKLNYGKKKVKSDPKEETPTRKSRRARKAADKDLELIQENMEGNIPTVGNVSLQASVEGKIDIQKPTMSFLPPSFKNSGGDGVGFIPYTSNDGKPPSISAPIVTSNSIQGSKNIFESFFKSYGPGNNEKSGNLKYMQVYIPGNSNPNSMDMGSFNINLEGSKAIKPNLKIPSEGSFQSIMPQFSKKDSHSILFKDKSGSLDGKINGFIGAKGSFANNNFSKHPPDNQK